MCLSCRNQWPQAKSNQAETLSLALWACKNSTHVLHPPPPFHFRACTQGSNFSLQDLVPYLVRHQSRQPLKGTERASSLANSLPSAERLLPGLDWPMGHRLGWCAGAFVAPASNYCKRANTLAAYGDVNKQAHATPCQSSGHTLYPSPLQSQVSKRL